MKAWLLSAVRCGFLVGWWLVVFGVVAVGVVNGQVSYNFSDLLTCTLTSLELSQLTADENVDPCILYDISDETGTPGNTTVTMVMVTPTGSCHQHRDGTVVGVESLNAGLGYAIGFLKDYYLKFRLISVIAGNPANLGNDVYIERHEALLRALLEYTTSQSSLVRYIVGTCSFYASVEKSLAAEHETIIATQVGPPGFYDPSENKWIFGFHVNSDDYPVASVRKLAFWAQQQRDAQTLQELPVRVVYRESSEFFRSTCESALRVMKDSGFTNVGKISYDPVGDADNDGTENFQDRDFLLSLADQVCPPGSSEADARFRPAIYMCVLTEHDILLERFRQNGCLMTALWLTPATWEWASNDVNKDSVDYYQGAGQWHESFSYYDDYFESGVALLDYAELRMGYRGGYDQVVCYAIPIFFAQHLQHVYRVYDAPDPQSDFADPARREELRRRMLEMRVDTIFGTVQFDANQRNIGRQAASTQWQPILLHQQQQQQQQQQQNITVLKNALFSPDKQAEVEVVLPASTAQVCPPGQFINATRLQHRLALLQTVCSECLDGTYTPTEGYYFACLTCPEGTSTDGNVGSSHCIQYEDNLLEPGMIAFGYVVLSLSWIMAFIFMIWIVCHRKDPVVRLAQIPFLWLICVGGLISSSSILGITFQAGTNESTDAPSTGCWLAPILYSIGWVIQYGALCAKTLRLQRIVEGSSNAVATGQGRRRAVTQAWASTPVIVIPLIVDIAILTAWTILDPLQYVRQETGRSLEDGILTIESVGRCRPSEGDSNVWIYLGPLFANHLLLVALTHYLLFKVRNVSNRYQEQKYLGMAAIFALEVAIVGVPILIAAQDSVEATFFVIVGIVGLDNMGVLGFIFIPKVLFQLKGLEEGVTVGESILSETHKRAVARESQLSSVQFASSQINSAVSARCAGGGQDSSRQSSLPPAYSNSNIYLLTTIAESESRSQNVVSDVLEDEQEDESDISENRSSSLYEDEEEPSTKHKKQPQQETTTTTSTIIHRPEQPFHTTPLSTIPSSRSDSPLLFDNTSPSSSTATDSTPYGEDCQEKEQPIVPNKAHNKYEDDDEEENLHFL